MTTPVDIPGSRDPAPAQLRRAAITPLTSLRLLACAVVVAFHLGLQGFSWGDSGVACFFVLSGFILAYNYGDVFHRLDGTSMLRFWIARVARIWPLHLLLLASTIPLVCGLESIGPARPGQLVLGGLLNATLLQGFAPFLPIMSWFDGPSWTLCVEVSAYAVLPMWIWLLRGVLRCSRRTLYLLAGASWLASLLLGWLLAASTDASVLVAQFVPLRMFDVFIGCCLGLAVTANRPVHGRVVSTARATVLEVLALVGVGVTIAASSMLPDGLRHAGWFVPSYAAVVLVLALDRGLLARALRWRPLVFGGEVSFAIYLVHMVVFRYVNLVDTDVARPSFQLAVVGITLGLAYFAWQRVEVPARRSIRRSAERLIVRSEATIGSSPAPVGAEPTSIASAGAQVASAPAAVAAAAIAAAAIDPPARHAA